MNPEPLVLHEIDGPVATLTLNRPKALNALNPELMDQLIGVIADLDKNDAVRCLVLTGNARAFAAGADIKAMADSTPTQMVKEQRFANWSDVQRYSKPIIAAVSGFALGGGCELAMLCDIIIASETAKFGQPEINIGIIPGAGGTQRLARAIGPYRAMELILTGNQIDAQEAYAAGLVNRVVPVERYLREAQELAAEIAARPPIAVRLAREAVRYGADTTVRDGLEIERRNFYLLFDSADQKEGMHAFLEKRKATFRGE